jgi:hypothetical protein
LVDIFFCFSERQTLLDVPRDSNKFERGTALFLRSFVLLLFAYIVFHKLFPFDLLDMRLVEMTGADFLLLCFRSVVGTAAALYLAREAFNQPPLRERDRFFCECWAVLGLGIVLIVACSIIMRFVESESIIVRAAKLVARSVVWLLFWCFLGQKSNSFGFRNFLPKNSTANSKAMIAAPNKAGVPLAGIGPSHNALFIRVVLGLHQLQRQRKSD